MGRTGCGRAVPRHLAPLAEGLNGGRMAVARWFKSLGVSQPLRVNWNTHYECKAVLLQVLSYISSLIFIFDSPLLHQSTLYIKLRPTSKQEPLAVKTDLETALVYLTSLHLFVLHKTENKSLNAYAVVINFVVSSAVYFQLPPVNLKVSFVLQ